MTKGQKTMLTAASGAILAVLVLVPLFDRDLSPVTKGALLGAAGALCLLAIALGAWNAHRGEARRRQREDIWMNH